MPACREFEELLSLHATEALEPAEATRVETHVAGCPGCRAELAATRELLGLAALPGPSAKEEALLEALPRRALGAWRVDRVRRAERLTWAAGLLAAAAVVLLVLVPRMGPRSAETPQGEPPVAAAPAPSEETDTPEALEQWALADPLGETLDEGLTEEDEDFDGALELAPEGFPELNEQGETP